MGQWFTVQFAKPTGFTDNYGNASYNVKFQEELDAALMAINPAKSQPPQPGDKFYGVVEERPAKNGSTYRKFTRQQPEDAGQTSSVQHKTYSGKQQDKDDAIQQGRCYNNAAAILATHPEAHTWQNVVIAKRLQELATAIYNLPQLEKAPQTAPTRPTDPVYTPTDDELNGPVDLSSVDDMFPGHVQLEMKK